MCPISKIAKRAKGGGGTLYKVGKGVNPTGEHVAVLAAHLVQRSMQSCRA